MLVRRLAITFVALAFVAAGCGSDSGDTQKAADQFRPLNTRLVALGESVGTTVQQASKKSDAEIGREFGDLARRMDGLRAQIAAIDAPSKVKPDRDDLARAMSDAGAALRGIQRAARKSDAALARTATLQLVRAAQALKEARARLLKALSQGS